MSFADFKGQDKAVSYLKAAIKNDRVSHAYIFFGPSGVGKRLTAVNFAKALNCRGSVDSEACDNCPSCKKIETGSHPDVFELKPAKEGGAVGIDEVRELIKNISLKPFEGKKKVFIIDNAQEMKHEAANALLKTLEEPPQDSVLILITDNLKAMFHTIVSRSRIVRFFPLKSKEIEEILKKEYSLDEGSAHVLSHLSSGRLGEALKFADKGIFTDRNILLNSVLNRSLTDLSFDNLPKEKVRIYLDILLTFFRDILNTKAGAKESLLINIDKKDEIAGEARRMSFEALDEIINSIMLTLTYMDQNVNPKLAMGLLGVKICGV